MMLNQVNEHINVHAASNGSLVTGGNKLIAQMQTGITAVLSDDTNYELI